MIFGHPKSEWVASSTPRRSSARGATSTSRPFRLKRNVPPVPSTPRESTPLRLRVSSLTLDAARAGRRLEPASQGTADALSWREHHILAARVLTGVLVLHVITVSLHLLDLLRD